MFRVNADFQVENPQMQILRQRCRKVRQVGSIHHADAFEVLPLVSWLRHRNRFERLVFDQRMPHKLSVTGKI
jgi:hypothetical protein